MMNKLVSYKNSQIGVVMMVTLISLVILMLASIALIRSTDTNLLIAGHLSFKRDIVNQAERALPQIRATFTTGPLAIATSREANAITTANYSATILPSSSTGIPNILLNTSTFDSTFPSNNIVNDASQVTVRYVIDRMSLAAGPCTLSICTFSQSTTDVGGDASNMMGGAGGGSGGSEKTKGQDIPVYRISIRASGPKNVETFMQYTFSI